MPPTIDYFLTVTSPWTYLGHDRFLALAERYGALVRWRPMRFPAVLAETGGVPLAQRPPARKAYRLVELQRWREKLAMPLNLQPAHFPADPDLANCAAIVLDEMGDSPAAFLGRAFRAVWVHDRDIADEQTVEALLAEAGHDARSVIAKARDEETGATYERHTREAISRGVFGSPTYVLNGEPFWGQDRLDMLEEALASGRGPYLPTG